MRQPYAVRRLVATLALVVLAGRAALAAGPHPTPSLPEVARFGQTVALRVPDELGDGILLLPPGCGRQACPLLLGSHRRGGSAVDGIDAREHPGYHRFVLRFASAGFAVLLSEDGGPNTWGNALALDNAERLWGKATESFRYDGTTFTLGTSMGGLPATLLRLTGRVPVRGTVLVDARLNLGEAFASADGSRVREIEAAYGLALPADLAFSLSRHDPLDARAGFVLPPAPTLAFASPDDRTVPLESNARPFVRLAAEHDPRSSLRELRGPHLGGSHLSEAVVDEAIAFMRGLLVSTAPEAKGQAGAKTAVGAVTAPR